MLNCYFVRMDFEYQLMSCYSESYVNEMAYVKCGCDDDKY